MHRTGRAPLSGTIQPIKKTLVQACWLGTSSHRIEPLTMDQGPPQPSEEGSLKRGTDNKGFRGQAFSAFWRAL